MPIYEYRCAACNAVFEKLRPMGQADAPLACTRCGSADTRRTLSLFAAVSKGTGGESRAVSGTGSGCGSCTASTCAGCSH